MLRRVLPSLVLLAAAAPPAPGPQEEILRTLHAMDVRVAEMTHRIAVAGVQHCARRVMRMVLVLEDAALYSGEEKRTATRLYGLGAYPVIAYPAQHRGLEVVGIDDRPLSRADPRQPRARIDAIDAAIEGGATWLQVQRGGAEKRYLPLGNVLGCPSRAQVLPSTRRDAKADGAIIQINSAVIEETQDDAELAFVIAHEMAHNILRHRFWLDTEGGTRKNILATEIAADRLALKLMKSARYDPQAASRFWARFGKKAGGGIFADGTHMATKQRIAFLRDEALKLAQ